MGGQGESQVGGQGESQVGSRGDLCFTMTQCQEPVGQSSQCVDRCR